MPCVVYNGKGKDTYYRGFPKYPDGSLGYYMLPPVKYPDGMTIFHLHHFQQL